MKKYFLFLLSVISVAAFGQQKMISQAIITTKTTIIVPEGEEDNMVPPPPSGDGQQVRIMSFGGAGETVATTYLKNDLVKTVIKTDMANTTTIRDNTQKKTTTLMEMMGRRTGFYATDEDMEQSRKRMDSMMQSRGGDATRTASAPASVEVVNAEGTKKIGGYECKKALVISTRTKNMLSSDGKLTQVNTADTSVVWYTPEFKLQGLSSTGGMGGAFSFGRSSGLGGLDKIDGFPMQYEMKMQRGRKMVVEVTKIETNKEVKDKEFEIPKDFDLKSMKDMQGPGGNFQMRIGG
ncbi:MAG: DUF4412 domain-containing protein [Ferruginibacter sp.]